MDRKPAINRCRRTISVRNRKKTFDTRCMVHCYSVFYYYTLVRKNATRRITGARVMQMGRNIIIIILSVVALCIRYRPAV